MEVTTTKCDTCGRTEQTEDYNEPKGWYYIGRQGDREKDFWSKRRDICDECALKLNLHMTCEQADKINRIVRPARTLRNFIVNS